jgi:hypothetical protein
MTNQWSWIRGPVFDSFFFISGVVFSPLAFFSFIFLLDHFHLHPQQAAIYLYAGFLLLFDQAHIFQTFSRSHLDSDEFKRNKKWHISLPILIIGLSPVYYLLELDDFIETLFIFFGMYHILKQNMGIMRIYQKKNGEYGGVDHFIDTNLMWSCLLVAVAPEVIELLHMDFNIELLSFLPLTKNISRGIFVLFILLFISRVTYRYLKTKKINLPKVLFVSAILLHYCFLYIYLYESYTIPLLVITVIDTIYHDIQYQGWMYHYHDKRWPKKPFIKNKMLIASYCYAGVVFLLYSTKDIYPQFVHEFLTLTVMLIVLYHYVVDGMIWKFDRAPEIRTLLH